MTDPTNQFFYDGKGYYLDTGSEFIPLDTSSVTRHLKARQMVPADIAATINTVQVERFVSFAGPLAGKNRGLYLENGVKLLATSSPKIITPASGKHPTVSAVIEGLLGDDPQEGQKQITIFLSWLKIARQSLVAHKWQPGQALVLAGPRGCGKSLLVDILEAALGGRRANPYQAFSGRTNFNGDLAGAELLVVDDEVGSTDIRARRHLAAAIKSNLFSGGVRIEGKHRQAFIFRPWWRLVIACNEEPENLLVLPPLTEDVGDKVTLLRCQKRPLPMPTYTTEDRDRFFSQIISELPSFLGWLDEWQIPKELMDPRCGVVHFHHRELVAALSSLSPEKKLEDLLSAAFANRDIWPSLPCTLNAAEVEARLVSQGSAVRNSALTLLSWQNACGSYLARLADGGSPIVGKGPNDSHRKARRYVIRNSPTIAGDSGEDFPF